MKITKITSGFVFWSVVIGLIFLPLQSKKSFGTGKGDGSGANQISVLFQTAVREAQATFNLLNADLIEKLSWPDFKKYWLLSQVKGKPRYQEIQLLLSTVKLDPPVDRPCFDGNLPRGSTFYIGPNGEPRMCLSITENKLTNGRDAFVMTIHDMGHGAEEGDHQFLDNLGLDFFEVRGALYHLKKEVDRDKDINLLPGKAFRGVGQDRLSCLDASQSLCEQFLKTFSNEELRGQTVRIYHCRHATDIRSQVTFEWTCEKNRQSPKNTTDGRISCNSVLVYNESPSEKCSPFSM